jgi:hypothetical protein
MGRHYRVLLLSLAIVWFSSGCHPWIDDVVVNVRDASLVSVRPAWPNARKGELSMGRVPAAMKAIDAGGASLWLRRNTDGSIVAVPTDHPGTLGPDIGTRLSAEGELVLPRVSEIPLRLAASRTGSREAMLVFPSRLQNEVIELVKVETVTIGEISTTTEMKSVRASDVVVFQSPVANVESAVRRRRGNAASGWCWLAVGVLFDSIALWVLQKGDRELGAADRAPLYAFVGGLAAFALPATGYGAYVLLSPETRTPLP